MSASPPWRIDRLREADLPAVMAIEKDSFSTPWPRGAFLEEIRSNVHARCLAARDPAGGEKAGARAYICYWILGDELLIHNLAVDRAYRRLGLARKLMEHAFEEARLAGCRTAYLEVRPSNAPALALYSDLGFMVVSRRRRYYADTNEDALVMRATLKGLETG